MSYTVKLSPKAVKALDKLSGDVRKKIIHKLNLLKLHPFLVGAKKLTGMNDLYRVRAGNYRIVYTVQNEELVVIVIRIGHRSKIYKGLG